MNLKRLRGIMAAALTGLAVALIAGCSNSMAGSVDGGETRMATLSISATGIPNDYAEQFAKSYPNAARNVAARSITPDTPYDVSDGTLTFKLSGKTETGKVLADTAVELVTPAVDGKYDFQKTDGSPVTLDAMSWNLKLVAYDGTAAVLQGFCSVDLRNGSGTAAFTMGTAGLTTDGSVELGGTIVDASDASLYYTMGIYRKDTGALVTGTSKTGTLTANSGANETFAYTQTTVAPGTYLYTMIFYDKQDADETKMNIVGSFTDTLIVDPGNALSRTNLNIDVIGKKPTAPTNLRAFLVNNRESSDGRTYEVKVTWTKGMYETNYELNLVESASDGSSDLAASTDPDDNGLIIGGHIYGMASMDKGGSVVNFAGSTVFGTDSTYMMYGDESCVLKLETGKVYEIQLRARNYIGTSEWADRVAGGTPATGYTAYDAPGTQRINRLLITYNLNGGDLSVYGDTAYKNKYASYASWIDGTTGNDLLVIGTTTSDNTLTKGGAAFESWLLESGSAYNDTTSVSTIGSAVNRFSYGNLTVKANFGNKVTGAIVQEDEKQDIILDDISILYGPSGSISATVSTADNMSVTKITAAGDPAFMQIKLSSSEADKTFNNIKFFAKRETSTLEESLPFATGLTDTCLVDLSDYSAGKLTVRIEADTNIPSVSKTLIFDLN